MKVIKTEKIEVYVQHLCECKRACHVVMYEGPAPGYFLYVCNKHLKEYHDYRID